MSDDYERVTIQMQQIADAFGRLAEAAQRTAFAVLDVTIEHAPVEDRQPVSWEVERERFLRGVPGYKAA